MNSRLEGGGQPARPRSRRRRSLLGGALVFALCSAIAASAVFMLSPAVDDVEQRIGVLSASRGAPDRDIPTPPRFASALIATEDSRFLSHHGLDVLGLGRVASAVFGSQGDPGGSTLDQQLAKLVYFDGVASAGVQVEEVALGVKLDHAFSKAQIMEMYSQSAYFGHGYYGLYAASCGYFGRVPASMDWAQATLLAGLVQAPSAYEPHSHPELARERQAHVLTRLTLSGELSDRQASLAAGQSWQLRSPNQPKEAGC